MFETLNDVPELPGWTLIRHAALADAGVPHGFLVPGPDTASDRDAFAAALTGYKPVADRRVLHGRQVHGAAVTTPESRHGPLLRLAMAVNGPDAALEADAHVSDSAEEVVAVRAADCVPLLLIEGGGRRVAAVHAGWRGLLAGVIPAALLELDAASCTALIGPCISAPHYEVGPEVSLSFDAAFLHHPDGPTGRTYLDLAAVAADQLRTAGVAAPRIHAVGLCTFANDWLPSFRRMGRGCPHLHGFAGVV